MGLWETMTANAVVGKGLKQYMKASLYIIMIYICTASMLYRNGMLKKELLSKTYSDIWEVG